MLPDDPVLKGRLFRAARVLLDHGPAQRTGLAWEHVASGLSPEAARRWAAIEFDPTTYEAMIPEGWTSSEPEGLFATNDLPYKIGRAYYTEPAPDEPASA